MREIARLFSVVEGERRYFQDLASNIPQALAIFDIRSTVAWSNSAFRKMYPPETASALGDVLPTATLRVAAKKILDGGRDQVVEQIHIGEPGKLLRFTLKPNGNWAGETELLMMVEDLTAPVEQAQHETAAHYILLEAITWELDAARMEFLRVDRVAAEALGFDGELWSRGRSFWSRHLSPEELVRLRAHYQSATGSPIVCEYRLIDRHGRTRWLRDRALLREGRIQGVTQEITEQIDRLEMSARAERIDAQRALAGAVAHDNNNLLMILRGYGEDLLQGLPADSPLQANVREIIAATERLAAHTRTLAAYTAKRPPPMAEMISIDSYLTEHREALMSAMPAGAELVLEPASNKANVSIDPVRINHCLRTMTESLEGSVRISTARVGEDRVRIAVVSTVGKAPPAGVFEIGAHPTMALGPELHTAYEFLRASGADVAVRPNGYEILLRRAADAPAAERPKDVVLVVDDEESIRVLVRKVLERAGYQVLEAASGEAALKISLEHPGPIGLLLSDVVMPGMSGVELAENLSLRRSEMRTLLISGFTGETALANARLPRGFEFLQKPFSLPDLLRKVKTLIEQGR